MRFARNRLALASVILMVLCMVTPQGTAGPDLPSLDGDLAVFSGNQSDGIRSTDWYLFWGIPIVVTQGEFFSPPIHELEVNCLSGPIIPDAGTDGIHFQNTTGENVMVRSGDSQTPVVISTAGAGANGIYAHAYGSPFYFAPVPEDPFLHIPIPGSSELGGGVVSVISDSNITTDGTGAHGINAGSATPGYPASVMTDLQSFSETGFTFEVTSIAEPNASLGTPVTGRLINADGNDIGGSGGTYAIDANGAYDFNPGTDFNDLDVNEVAYTAVDYHVLGHNSSGDTNDIEGTLITTVTRTADGLSWSTEAYFDKYGVSLKPQDDPNNPGYVPTVFPDLQGYVDGLIAKAGAGGMGNSVTVVSNGPIWTKGYQSHGILAQSQGGAGYGGGGGSISHSASGGGPGSNGGHVSVSARGSITTDANESGGIVAISTGGVGGPGGNGGSFRHGARGGTGGDGGLVTVGGDATITTWGDYSSGILALSNGGNGGSGGSGSGAMPGGSGGWGGRGGAVQVDGDWDITTNGAKAHGIWAKSLGGNAGAGGSGGWLFGSPGGGGQATNGGQVTLTSGGEIETFGTDSYGLYAQSVGGFGGAGSTSWGLFWSFGGDGGSAGSGGDVAVTNESSGVITTHEARAHGIYAQSIGGGGGSGGGEFGLLASLGGSGAAGGHGGNVMVTNNGSVETFGRDAYGLYAQSIGGGGGDGGGTSGMVAVGGKGSGTSDGNDVTVTNTGTIQTHGLNAHGIFAESIGGGGGNGGLSGGWITVGGSGGGGGNAGVVAIANVGGEIATDANDAHGIFAQSVGGGGGNGGGAISGSANLIGVAIGGDAGIGGHGSEVNVSNVLGGTITTGGDRSYGIYGQSVGGGGGTGGFAIAAHAGGGVAVSVGGTGGGGGNGDAVHVLAGGTITTSGEEAHGVLAQSVGGGGGTGGFSISASAFAPISANLALGGSGGSGGAGGTVDVNSAAHIVTDGNDAHAILAQSVGGGGGTGGFSVAGSFGGGTNLNLSFGGKGGMGGKADAVHVQTELDLAREGIVTTGDRAYGILAQSVGGGGGNGGVSVSGAAFGGSALGLSFGGKGGAGSRGGSVDVDNGTWISTDGWQSYGIMAQSVGGGGGNGGLSLSAALTAFGGLSFGLGGAGGVGNSAGAVDVNNTGIIETWDEFSHGIVAQSIGGGGGNGGTAGAVMVNFSSLIPVPPEIPITGSVNLGISIGGEGGAGGRAGTVDVTNAGTIVTHEDFSYGIYAQSVGGGGGNGGKSVAATANISVPESPEGGGGGGETPQPEIKIDFALAIGGKGGAANDGNDVRILNRGSIDTAGDSSHGIFAQSVGGGGGVGGNARAMTLSIDPANWSPSDPPPSLEFSKAINISVGGDAGAGGDAGSVSVDNVGDIVTRNADAVGIFAQSIGGGGGTGGEGSHGLDWTDLGVPEDIAPFLDLAPIESDADLAIVVGGKAGSSGDGNNVSVRNEGNITTLRDGSFGILAQSIGAGGGIGGFGAVGDDGTVGVGGAGGAAGNGGAVDVNVVGTITTVGAAAHGIFAQSIGGGGGIAGNVDGGIGLSGINLAFGQGGGSAGNGGAVTVTDTGDIITWGSGSYGIFAQSVGGGGGVGGQATGGWGFAGSTGGDGSAGRITITHNGDIITHGDASHGIFAQSAGGLSDAVTQRTTVMDSAGFITTDGQPVKDDYSNVRWGANNPLPDHQDIGSPIDIAVDGNVVAYGLNSHGIFAQSVGSDANGDISVNILGGAIQGGRGSGAGVYLMDGANNTLTNTGNIFALSGTAIVTGAGNDTVDNDGTISGTVDLGAGSNAFHNHATGLLNAGATLNLGPANTLNNDGTLAPGGAGGVMATNLTGHLAQSDSGVLAMDMDATSDQSDRLDVSGGSDLAGTVRVDLVNAGYFTSGSHQATILTSAEGVTNSGLALLTEQSALVNYELLFPNETDVQIRATIDTVPAGLNANQRRIGAAIGRIQAAGGSASFAPFAAALLGLPDVASLGAAYDSLSPTSYDFLTTSTFDVSQQYTQTLLKRLHSLRKHVGDAGGSLNEEEPRYGTWVEGFGHWANEESHDGFAGFDYDLAGAALGLDYLLEDTVLAGVSFSESRASIDTEGDLSQGDIDSYFGSLYGSYFTSEMYVDATLSYGRQSYDNVRLIDIGGLSTAARSEHDGDLYSAYAETGCNVDFELWVLQPFAALRYLYLDEEGFRETGAGGANLVVGDRTTDALISDLGLRLSRPFHKGSWLIIPELMVAWDHDFDIDDRVIVARLDGTPASSFAIDSREIDRDGALLGAELTLVNQDHLNLDVRYIGEVRSHYDSHAVTAGMRYEF